MNSVLAGVTGTAVLLACAIASLAIGAVTDRPVRDSIAFPNDDSVLDLRRDFGARGDGVIDDTEALQRGIEASCRSKGKQSKVLFIPDGVYRVSHTLVVKPSVGPWVWRIAGRRGYPTDRRYHRHQLHSRTADASSRERQDVGRLVHA
jgi:hypothetical protein